MADPLKTMSDTSGGELMAANKVVRVTRIVPSHEEYSQSCGSVDPVGSTTRVATAAEAGERSARKYDSNRFKCMSNKIAVPPAKCTPRGFWSLENWDGIVSYLSLVFCASL
jgi:hypothetical protein